MLPISLLLLLLLVVVHGGEKLTTPTIDLSFANVSLQHLHSAIDTVPVDVKCRKVLKCDQKDICVKICARGSVVVSKWLQNALTAQRLLSHRFRSFCAMQIPGSHNSAITMADGYGLEDHVFQRYLKFLRRFGKEQIHTNDQLFSLTDQLQMGVRFLEIDVHWFDDELRVAHCGGFHTSLLDHLISLLNKIAKLFGEKKIQWDSETIGCKPSLSSIPANETRRVEDAIEEIATWMRQPQNKKEFVIIFFDDETDLGKWHKVKKLVNYVTKHFAEDEIFKPSDAAVKWLNEWPTVDEMLRMGKRVIFLSGSNYKKDGESILFVKSAICNWLEPDLPLKPFPQCHYKSVSRTNLSDKNNNYDYIPENTGILRPQTSEIRYGFLNAEGHFGKNKHLLNEKTIPKVMECGTSIPSPDNLTPKRMESFVWSFDKDEPKCLNSEHSTEPRLIDKYSDKCCCIVMGIGSSRWKSVDCNSSHYIPACLQPSKPRKWTLGDTETTGYEKNASSGCLSDSVYYIPTSGLENRQLYEALKAKLHERKNLKGVWLNMNSVLPNLCNKNKLEHSKVYPNKEKLTNQFLAIE